MSKLRGVTDDEQRQRLDADREHVAFVADDVEIDVRRVDATAARRPGGGDRGSGNRGRRCCRANFLTGWICRRAIASITGAWRSASATACCAAACWTALTERLRDDPARALPHARALVTADPLSEVAHATLIRVLTQCGRQQDAELHCERTAELLRREVGVSGGGRAARGAA